MGGCKIIAVGRILLCHVSEKGGEALGTQPHCSQHRQHQPTRSAHLQDHSHSLQDQEEEVPGRGQEHQEVADAGKQ